MVDNKPFGLQNRSTVCIFWFFTGLWSHYYKINSWP